MLKEVNYMGNKYSIQYDYEIEKRIDGFTHHTLTLVSKNGVGVKYIKESWQDKGDSSIIERCGKLIKKHIELNKTPFNYNNEFCQWGGNLDAWDE